MSYSSRKAKDNFKIIAALFFAFALVNFLSTTQMFLGSSPRFHPAFLSRFQEKLGAVPSNFVAFLKGLNKPSLNLQQLAGATTAAPQGVIFREFSKGVKASEDSSYIKVEKGTTFKVFEYTANSGKKYKVLIPQR